MIDHTEYWVEVSPMVFFEAYQEFFGETGKLGHTNFQGKKCPPEFKQGLESLVIHQQSAIYDDFKIESNGAGLRFYLHNYGFWVQ